jgi:glycosyltransferase involved in cell wall biosynthesis
VLSGDRSIRIVGGAEVQQCTLAREFVRRGYEVSMVCMNFGQPDGIVIDGITVHRMHAPDEGVPVLRFVHPRLTSVWRAMKRADADIYYQRTAGVLTAYVVAFARHYGRKSVFAAGSDRDFFPQVPHVNLARDRALFRWGVRHAGVIVAQTERQADMCLRTFGRKSAVIRSCYGHRGAPASRFGPVIWVANLLPVKRAELFVELARRLPEIQFKLVGGADQRRLDELKTFADGIDNLEFAGHVPFADVEQHFDSASILVNTSVNEGFPNTFLQAWARGMPTVSFFDPEAFNSGEPVGWTSATIDDMVAQIALLHSRQDLWERQARLTRSHFNANYAVTRAVDEYEAALSMRAPQQSNQVCETV